MTLSVKTICPAQDLNKLSQAQVTVMPAYSQFHASRAVAQRGQFFGMTGKWMEQDALYASVSKRLEGKEVKIGLPCCGIDGLGQALIDGDIVPHVAWAMDIDQSLYDILSQRYSPTALKAWRLGKYGGDVSKVDYCTLPDVDFIAMGPPCQGFSSAGKMAGKKDPRSHVFYVCLEYIEHFMKRPNFLGFLCENSPNIAANVGGEESFISDVMQQFEDHQNWQINVYMVQGNVNCGYPQLRKRCIVTGVKKQTLELVLSFIMCASSCF